MAEANDKTEPADAEREWQKWKRELDAAEAHEKTWAGRARKIVKRYRDERDNDKNLSQFNILYSNTEVLRGAVYQKTPIPEVRRRFNDRDPVGKAASEVIDRCLTYSIDSYDFDGTIKAVVEDSLLPGRGIARVKYVPHIVGEQVAYEEVKCEYHDWEWFRYSPAKRWDKVRWVAFGDLLTRDDLERQFPNVGKEVKLDWAPEGKEAGEDNEVVRRAIVWSIWDKTKRKLVVWASGYNKAPLAVVDDPLKLEGFFPCPHPLYQISTTGTLIPVPEYTQYQDQALELDEITGRITALTDALRFRGVYDTGIPQLQTLAKAGDNEFIGVENFAALVEKGGIEKAFMPIPIEGIAKVILGLYEQREQLKQTIYEVTGISDIFRGDSEASETATAQQIKAQYGGIRIRGRQQAVQVFARDLLRLKAEIMAEHFSPETLSQISGLQFPSAQDKQLAQLALQQAKATGQEPDPAHVETLSKPSWEEILQVIRNDKLRGFKIDIETDSTIQPDQQVEQQSRIEALSAIGDAVGKLIPAMQAGVTPPELVKESISWMLRSFKNPGQFEEALEKMEQMPPPQQGPDPEVVAELERREQAIQQGEVALQEAGLKLQADQAGIEGDRSKLDAERSAFDEHIKIQLEKVGAFADAAMERISGKTDALKMRQQAAKATKPRPSA